eukprot:TRINITY_DN7112_c0_g1_i1.p1 TRINITY_DN7112_c0_g1~~TRINITY_DN7112_c0_g1_i1.p1  ORF type:complete len:622 (+),score=146.02 TRINITY_DN7112_c0_g1_i1:52-1917(+)
MDDESGSESSGSVRNRSGLSIGLELSTAPDLVQSLDEARAHTFEFIVVPLVHPRYERDLVTNPNATKEPFTRSDFLLNSSQWSSVVVGKISTWLQLDSPIEKTRKNARKVLQQELSWASHLSLPAVLLPPPTFNSANYAQIVNQTLQSLLYMQIWVRIPLVFEASETEKSNSKRRFNEPWEWWNNVRTQCEHHPSLSPVIEITEDLPSAETLAKWLGEPVKAAILPTNVFITNKAGYPILSRQHQAFVVKLFLYKVQFVIKGNSQFKNGLEPYLQYLHFLYNKFPPFTEKTSFEIPYLDYLQAPLQPLMDNLESQTYETFEKDTIKYDKYQEAMHKFLLTKPAEATIVLMVVGAGRGPLVRAALTAANLAERNIRVYAVEKNPNAVITLQNLKISLKWGDRVTIVDSDMRTWEAPEKADVLVSELLGSFGDNELSPECLDGAQRFLKDDGISIPASSTSFVSPISSSKLYNEVKNWKDLKHFETAYVVRLHNINVLSPAQECFTFLHPNKDKIIDNTRYKKFVFHTKESATMHGFAGYFETKLFEDVYLSINPATHTPTMYSWFPLYFPLREPMYVPEGAIIECHFWRNCSKSKVWYEWTVSSPDNSPIHNVGGRSYWIGL